MVRRILLRRQYLSLGALLIIVIALGALYSVVQSVSAAKAQPDFVPTNIIVRVSGTEGTPFSARIIGNVGGPGPDIDADYTLSSEPINYDIPGDVVVAIFKKHQLEGTLKVELLADDRVITTREAPTGSSIVAVSFPFYWSYVAGPGD
jgi:hypothetical protein